MFNKDSVPGSIQVRGKRLRLPLFFVLASATIMAGVGTMLSILQPGGVTPLEFCLLGLFALTFTWITIAFWGGIVGFVLQLLGLDPFSLRRHRTVSDPAGPVSTRTAVVMPVYNEDTARVMAGFEANLRSLAETGQAENFDFYLLSDTQDPELARAELGAWQQLIWRLGALAHQVHYRRRDDNRGKKAGNLADFCQRWGSRYDWMIVLDADSLMTGDCMLALVHAMEANPRAGLIQTVPLPVRQRTFFGRFMQFAATLYGPMLARGLAFWQTDGANYWGHNAIIRIEAFTRHCGLPRLPGPAPFGGEIMSHDFVEAALLRRTGWQTLLLADLEGSYEEVPSNILDYIQRDRRWIQGNIQHLALVIAPGFRPLNRLHFVLGAAAYVTSLLWLLMLWLSTGDAVLSAATGDVFFASGQQLFPHWTVTKNGLISTLFYFTAILLLLPKLLGSISALARCPRAFGGAPRLLGSTLIEALFAILIAPLMMVYHAFFVLSVLAGRQVSWDCQVREGRLVPWREALRRTLLPMAVGFPWAAITYYFAPTFLWWLLPVLAGLISASFVVRYSSSPALGMRLRQLGLLQCPTESREPPILVEVSRLLDAMPSRFPTDALEPKLPLEQWRTMPMQSLTGRREAQAPAAGEPQLAAIPAMPSSAKEISARRKNGPRTPPRYG